MDVYLVDGTYELFRHFFALPRATDPHGNEIAALRGVVASIVGMLDNGATHLGVATDHVIESFRNEIYPGYKTGEGIEPALMAQFRPLESALASLGVRVWAMVDQEADDALAAAAARADGIGEVDHVFVCSPDKDLAQCVRGTRVVQLDRRKSQVRDEAGVVAKFGVGPESIPDYLALTGDPADGYPGLPGWGPRSAATILARYPHLEAIPRAAEDWDIQVRGASRLAATLGEQFDAALLFRRLATLRTDHHVFDRIDELRWRGPQPDFRDVCESLRTPKLLDRVKSLSRPTA